MSSRMTNLELSTSIKDYIKELFEGNIKQILENNTETIIKLNEKIDELIIKIDNIDKKNNNNNTTYADITSKQLLNIESTIKKTINKNISEINGDNLKNKSIIIYNANESDFADNKSKYDTELKLVNNIIKTVTDDSICNNVIKFHRLGKRNDVKIQNNKIRPIKVIFKNEIDKINIIKHAFKLKDSEYNKVGITHEFSIDQLNIQSDLIKKAKSKSTDDVKYKEIFINNSFKTISIVSESQQYDE